MTHETGQKVVGLKSEGVDSGEGKCGERETGLLVSEIWSLEILPVKEPKQARDVTEERKGNDYTNLRCNRF